MSNQGAQPDTETRLFIATRHGYLNEVKALIKADPDCVNAGGDPGGTILMFSLQNRQFGIAELLIQHGAAINDFGIIEPPSLNYSEKPGPKLLKKYRPAN